MAHSCVERDDGYYKDPISVSTSYAYDSWPEPQMLKAEIPHQSAHGYDHLPLAKI